MKPYLIALDMDGTLLKSDQTISYKTTSYLQNLASQGHKIIIASGRPLRGILPYYQQLNLNTPVICYNGGVIYPQGNKDFPHYEKAFPKELIISLIEEIGLEYLDNIICESHNDIYLLHSDDSLDTFFNKKKMLVHIGEMKKILNEDCLMVCIKIKNPKHQNYVKEIVERHEHIKLRFWSGKWLEISEIYYEDVNKGKALQEMMNYFAIPYERAIAFGDACNDLEMLKDVKYGFCMLNGEDETKKAASYITECDNDDDGIVKALDKLFKEIE